MYFFSYYKERRKKPRHIIIHIMKNDINCKNSDFPSFPKLDRESEKKVVEYLSKVVEYHKKISEDLTEKLKKNEACLQESELQLNSFQKSLEKDIELPKDRYDELYCGIKPENEIPKKGDNAKQRNFVPDRKESSVIKEKKENKSPSSIAIEEREIAETDSREYSKISVLREEKATKTTDSIPENWESLPVNALIALCLSSFPEKALGAEDIIDFYDPDFRLPQEERKRKKNHIGSALSKGNKKQNWIRKSIGKYRWTGKS